MKKIYHLSSCNTCQRIIKDLEPLDGFTLQDIKTEAITLEELAEMHELTDSYESLFSRRAVLYRERGLEQYTFLKRPVIINDGEIFIGNSKKVVAAAIEAIHS